ncbi:fumarylacetoacetate hydrolase family protein [Amycolatopsis pithecellobii]|uniref:Fumarylacetoacetate hydrolase n=1 Tax=Amycolatopsis pithecellobii TaxID=664692 RepID=A0A6N7ZCU7_9PSEU|nr:fumarylacetoacetate hydrolase family protein [Amycolatopsis pithecellobii]MTD59558.1 fumarylacetoacetate hydrolase [Amycolatopsis pithecellobii]
MRFMNHGGRLTLVIDDDRGVDVHRASGGSLPADPAQAFERWADVLAWARTTDAEADVTIRSSEIGPPSPAPRQTLAVGVNYASHAAEAHIDLPEHPMIFDKLRAAVAGPYDTIEMFTDTVDWEIELAVVIGATARRVPASRAWDHVAGLTVSQDLSDRTIQLRPKGTPQYVLGKSLPGFGPTGPVLVTADEFDNPADLELTCLVNGEQVQHARTSDFIFSIEQIIEYLSASTILYPGDVIMTGTPGGIGGTRVPPRFLRIGDVLESRIEGIGTMRHTFAPETA